MRTITIIMLVLAFQVQAQNNKSIDKSFQFEVNGVSFDMIPVKGGTFIMGTDRYQRPYNYSTDELEHQVSISNYCIGQTEVTQALWKAVMGDNPSFFKGNDLLPVESVSWEDCHVFINKLNSITGKKFRLPTEAEWEFAARGGGKSDMIWSGTSHLGLQLESVAWFKDNSKGQLITQENVYTGKDTLRTHPVKTRRGCPISTPFNTIEYIYDMSGNVWEWCQDYYDHDYYQKAPQMNPCNTRWDVLSVCRGGGYSNNYETIRTARRRAEQIDWGSSGIGLRLACDYDAKISSQSKSTVKTSNIHNINKDETQPSFPSEQNGLFQPSFPGGQQGLITWLSDNCIYPEEAEKRGIQGEVVISFIVEKDGSLSNISVLNSVHPLLDNEALRLVRKMPKWEPVKIEGIAVPVKLNFPITFKLRK